MIKKNINKYLQGNICEHISNLKISLKPLPECGLSESFKLFVLHLSLELTSVVF